MDKSHHFEKTGSHLEQKNAENDSPAPMFMPKKDLLAIYELLFRAGVVVPSRMSTGLNTPGWQKRMCLVFL